MRFIKLTAVPHPEINGGVSTQTYVDPSRIMLIDRGSTAFTKKKAREEYRQALGCLFDEVQRVAADAGALQKTVVPQSEEEARQVDRWMSAREVASALSAAYGLVSSASQSVGFYPDIDCTVIQLACGTALEHGVMLARVFVMESPEEVMQLIEALGS